MGRSCSIFSHSLGLLTVVLSEFYFKVASLFVTNRPLNFPPFAFVANISVELNALRLQ